MRLNAEAVSVPTCDGYHPTGTRDATIELDASVIRTGNQSLATPSAWGTQDLLALNIDLGLVMPAGRWKVVGHHVERLHIRREAADTTARIIAARPDSLGHLDVSAIGAAFGPDAERAFDIMGTLRRLDGAPSNANGRWCFS